MLNDFVPVINKLKLTEHPNSITVVPLADAHYGSPDFNETRWHNVIKRIQDDPHCFTVLVGDLLDTTLKNSVGDVYKATASPNEQKEWLYNELLPIADKILGATDGNHERRAIKDADSFPLYDVMLRLGKENLYRPNVCFMEVKLCYDLNGNAKQRFEFKFCITHGAGGGQYIGSSANRAQNFAAYIEGVDVFVTAHTHKPLTFPMQKLLFTSSKVIQKQFVVAVASSFLDYGGYTVQKMLPPAAHTTTEIILTYSSKKQHIRVVQ